MNVEQEIKHIIRKTIMDEIDNLAIKSVIREYVENAIAKDEVVAKIDSIIDSYFRSALGEQNVTAYVRSKMNAVVAERCKKECDAIMGRYSHWNGSKAVEDAIIGHIRSTVQQGFNVSVSVTPKEKRSDDAE